MPISIKKVMAMATVTIMRSTGTATADRAATR